MQEISMMYVITKCIALATSVAVMLEAGDEMTQVVILSLVLSCIIAAQYILALKGMSRYISTTVNISACIFCFITNPEQLLPVLVILMIENIDYLAPKQQYYLLIGCTTSLLLLIISPGYVVGLITAVIVCFLCYARYIVIKVVSYRVSLGRQKEDLLSLEEKIKDNNRLIKTLRYTAALEERNRLAARLHDKIGHGISGSIIMLEASMMMLERDGAKAKEGIEKSIANLREGVDDIREALKEERPIKSELGINEIKAKLEEFRANYGIITNLIESGDLQRVNIETWYCIHANLEEALTNLLKHSNATTFTIKIAAMNKVLSVEYRDNGTGYTSENIVIKGLGLEAMEERTVKCGGNFFIEQTDMGFKIMNIFLHG